MTRRSAREVAFHLLFELCFQENQPLEEYLQERLDLEALAGMSAEHGPYAETMTEKDRTYIIQVVQGVEEQKEQLDEIIGRYAENWSTKRISKISSSILRLALYEKDCVEDVPVSVAINEAVDLAKEYESEEAGAFVNGILGAIVRGEKE